LAKDNAASLPKADSRDWYLDDVTRFLETTRSVRKLTEIEAEGVWVSLQHSGSSRKFVAACIADGRLNQETDVNENARVVIDRGTSAMVDTVTLVRKEALEKARAKTKERRAKAQFARKDRPKKTLHENGPDGKLIVLLLSSEAGRLLEIDKKTWYRWRDDKCAYMPEQRRGAPRFAVILAARLR